MKLFTKLQNTARFFASPCFMREIANHTNCFDMLAFDWPTKRHQFNRNLRINWRDRLFEPNWKNLHNVASVNPRAPFDITKQSVLPITVEYHANRSRRLNSKTDLNNCTTRRVTVDGCEFAWIKMRQHNTAYFFFPSSVQTKLWTERHGEALFFRLDFKQNDKTQTPAKHFRYIQVFLILRAKNWSTHRWKRISER